MSDDLVFKVEIGAGLNQGLAVVAPSQSDVFFVDNINPVVPSVPALLGSDDTGLSNSDRITNVNKPTFVGNSDPFAIVEIHTGLTLIGKDTANGSGNYTILIDSIFAISSRLTSSALRRGVLSIKKLWCSRARNAARCE